MVKLLAFWVVVLVSFPSVVHARDLFQCTDARTGDGSYRVYLYTELVWGGEAVKADIWRRDAERDGKLGTWDCMTTAGASGLRCSKSGDFSSLTLLTQVDTAERRRYISLIDGETETATLWCEFRS